MFEQAKQENLPPMKPSVKDRLGAQVPPMQVKVMNAKVAPQLTEEEIEEVRTQSIFFTCLHETFDTFLHTLTV